jgi:UDP-N-acetylglucosamine/UDP-N-acetylgalactosamine diphosphorylase
MTNLTHIHARLTQYGQSHLLQWWDELNESQRDGLLAQLESIDYSLITRLFSEREAVGGSSASDLAARATPPTQLVAQPKTAAEKELWRKANALGEEQLRDGKVGAILVAGGQGTRLGFDKPKGMYPIGPVSQRSLYQVFCEQLLARGRRAGAAIPYFIMTSDATHDDTVAFFEENHFFGLKPRDVYFFRQGKLPAVCDQTGRIHLSEKHEVALTPDGHGGILKALRTSGLLDLMRDRGLESLYYHQVDNPMAIVCDPAFLGLHELHGSDLSTKAVSKVSAEERMGVLVDVEGQTQIIEYSDMPVERTREVETDGTLRFRAGNTAMHVIRRGFLQDLVDQGRDLPYHRAHKPVPHIDRTGQRVEPGPTAKNAFKFEQFIFDSLPLASTALVVEADRTREFNPVKNREGADSPETSRAAIFRLNREWLRAAGAEVADDARVEISPLVALTPEDLKGRVAPGQVFPDGAILRP